ncbi:prefoldin subunit 2 [Paragonimus westermani]|uniref:Prefoldin subunit 2 n=1 Tax=Paragonimus westermani TaxID=34504 RepID=A0A5J4NM82_9TREM|nr:prefoldin subunit 2 [Paragonimus westermani]
MFQSRIGISQQELIIVLIIVFYFLPFAIFFLISMVIKVLQGVDPNRKCMRMIDNVLIERQVKDILPALQLNVQKMTECIENLTKQFEEKGWELQRYKTEHKIRIAGEKESNEPEKKDVSSSGVLVS